MKMQAPDGITCTSVVGDDGKTYKLVPDKDGLCNVPNAAGLGAASHGWVAKDGWMPAGSPGAHVTTPTMADQRAPADYPRAAGQAPVSENVPEAPRGGVRQTIARTLKSIAELGAPPRTPQPDAPPEAPVVDPTGAAHGEDVPVTLARCAACDQGIPPEAPSVDVPDLGLCHLGCTETK